MLPAVEAQSPNYWTKGNTQHDFLKCPLYLRHEILLLLSTVVKFTQEEGKHVTKEPGRCWA